MSERIGKNYLALYVTGKKLESNLVNKVEYFWIDETKGKIYNILDYFINFNKKIICCSPEVYSFLPKNSLERFKGIIDKNIGAIFGVCTDFIEELKTINES